MGYNSILYNKRMDLKSEKNLPQLVTFCENWGRYDCWIQGIATRHQSIDFHLDTQNYCFSKENGQKQRIAADVGC